VDLKLALLHIISACGRHLRCQAEAVVACLVAKAILVDSHGLRLALTSLIDLWADDLLED